jgi:hypothetical protein
MLPSIKRWRDWAMTKFWTIKRRGPRPVLVHYRYEKRGLVVSGEPIPWNAESTIVEAKLHLPAGTPRRRMDFWLRISGQAPIPAESFRRGDLDESCVVSFRFSPPGRTVMAEVLWRHRRLAQLTLPWLGQEEFLERLQLARPTLFVRLGHQSVACQTFVAAQCRGLIGSAIISSPTSLAPFMDLGLRFELRAESGELVQSVPVSLTAAQLAERQALVAVVPRRLPRRAGAWTMMWLVGNRLLASQRICAISTAQFHHSLKVNDTWFIVEPERGQVRPSRQLPAPDGIRAAGPCFVISSCEPGMAGLASLSVTGVTSGSPQSSALFEQRVLVTDGPTPVAPGMLEVTEMAKIGNFELRNKKNVLGVLSTSPVPQASFSPEGGFKPGADYTWTVAADEELKERLNMLLEERSAG